MQKRRKSSQRGVTLLEGMMASVVLLLGLVGILNGIIFAARQNSVANKMVRAGALANRIRAGLMTQGPGRFNANAVTTSRCTSGNIDSYKTDGRLPAFDASSLPSGISGVCAMNLKEFEESSNDADKKIAGRLGDYVMENFEVVLLKWTDSSGRTVGATIVVSWFDALRDRKHHTQYVAFYDNDQFKGANL